MRDNLKLEPVKDLPDVSSLAVVFDSRSDCKRRHPTAVRVIEYTVEDGRAHLGPYRLLTTILDLDQAPATELAVAYAQRLASACEILAVLPYSSR